MSKPREFIFTRKQDAVGKDFDTIDISAAHDLEIKNGERFTVIEKSAADELAEALENVLPIIYRSLTEHVDDNHECWDMYGEADKHINEALKEYRSGVATDQDEGPGGEK